MALLAGEGGLGKSQIMLWIASAISNGSPWPDGAGDAPLGQVIIMTAEDSAETTIKPRLIAMGANMRMIKLIPAPKVIIKGPDKDRFFGFKSLVDHGYWERIFELFPQTKLLIVDPVVSYLGKGVNDQKNDEVRSAIEPFLERIIRPRGICFFANTHLNKTLEAKSVQHRITGSIAYVNLPRNVHCVLRDSENPEKRIFGQCKTNNAPLNLKSLEFKIEKRTIESKLGEIETSMPVFSADLVEVNMTRVVDGHRGAKGPAPAKSIENAKWLFNQLKDCPVRFSTLKADALEAGILAERTGKVSTTPLYHAKDRFPSVFPGFTIGDMELDGRLVWELVKTDAAPGDDKPPF
jgi:putative DNA primase/helicase